MYGIAPNDPLVEFVDEKTGRRTTIIDENKLSAIIDQQGRFVTPFSLYSVNGIRK